MADEEIVQDAGAVEGEETMEQETVPEAEESLQAQEFVPEGPKRAKSDVYTLLLILTFVAFVTASIIGGRELYDNYDVQFWGIFSKEEEEVPEEGEEGYEEEPGGDVSGGSE
ncbi:MAG: hypothetical protein ACYTAF_04520 [Planctomycetota bacterium]|jgi:hypothetical protein